MRLVVADPDLHRRRWSVLLRLVLAIPLLVWMGLWSFATLVVAVVAWVIVVVTGRLPVSLQDYFRAFVRFEAHLYAYLSFAADGYPSFVGKPGYAIDVEFDPTPRQRRWTAAIRIVLALPALVFAVSLAGSIPFPSAGVSGEGSSWSYELASQGGGALVVVAVLGWFVSLARGRMSGGLRDLAVYAIGYGAQVSSYLFFLTERYPSADPACVLPPLRVPSHPVRIENGGELRRPRLLVLLRPPLCVPHLVWLSLWSVLVLVISPLAWLLVLILGRLPLWLHRFLAAWVRAWAQLTAFATLVGGPFPGFVGAHGYPVELATDPAASQRRLHTLLRLLLVIPAQFLAAVYAAALLTAAVLAWLAALLTGRAPSGLQAFGAVAVRYLAQTNAYLFLVTDRYPYASPGLATALPEPPPGPAE